MRVALVQPNKPEQESNAQYPGHLGLSYLSYHLKEQGNEVVVADANMHEDPIARVTAFHPDFVGVNVGIYDHVQSAELIARMRAAHPSATYVVGGSQATRNTRKLLEDTHADYAVAGDGIPTFQRLIQQETNAPGIAFLQNGQFISHGTAPYKPDNWHIDTTTLPDSARTYYAISSLGCYGRCSFCKLSEMFPKIIFRSLDKVVADMAAVAQDKGAKYFIMGDDNFLVKPDRLVELDALMTAQGLGQKIGFMARADSVLIATSQLDAARQRLDVIDIGVESFVDAQLTRWNKGITAQQNMDAIEALREQGIYPRLYYIVGDAESTLDEMNETSAFFMQHPELLTMVFSVNMYKYRDSRDATIPSHVPVYYEALSTVARFNRKFQMMRNSQHKFLQGDGASPAIKKKITQSLHSLDYIAARVRKGKMSEKDAKEAALLKGTEIAVRLSKLYN